MAERKDRKFTSWMSAQKPAKLRCMRDGEELITIKVEGVKSRNKWADLEESVESVKPSHVQALDKDGDVKSSYGFEDEKSDEPSRKGDGADFKGQAAIVRAIAETHNEAFAAGAEAASRSSDALIALVETLVVNLNAAIVNNHNMAVALGNVLTGKDPEEGASSGSSQAMERLIMAMASRSLAGPPAATPPAPNGSKK